MSKFPPERIAIIKDRYELFERDQWDHDRARIRARRGGDCEYCGGPQEGVVEFDNSFGEYDPVIVCLSCLFRMSGYNG